MRAAAENFEMARLLSVRADRVIAVSFAIGGALAAAVLLVAQTGQVSPTMGLTPVLVGFIAVVIGGFGPPGIGARASHPASGSQRARLLPKPATAPRRGRAS
jgi:branched-subunit amino acid ABC-type transport system permease component